MFRFCSIFLASVYALMLKIFGFISKYVERSKSCVSEENGSNFSTKHSQNSMVLLSCGLAEKELQKGKIDSNGSITEIEGSVFLQSGLISNSSKCQFMSGNNVSGYLEEPKTVKFVIQEMFVGSDDVLVNSDQSLDFGISERKDPLEQKLEKNHQELCEESNTSLFHFKLFNEDNQELISELEYIGQKNPDGNHTKFLCNEEDYEEKEKLNSVDYSKDFQDSVEDEVFEDHDFSYEIELLPLCQFSAPDSENWMSNFLDKNDDRKPEDLEEKHDFDIKNLVLDTERVDDLDEEYIELEPMNLSHIGKESIEESDKRDKMQTEEKTTFDSSQETKNFWDSDSDDDEDEHDDVLWEHQHLVRQMKMELKNCRIKGLPTISEESETTPKIAEDLKPLKFDQKIEYKDVMEEIQKFYKSYLEKMRKLDILNYQTLHAISFLQLKDSEVFTAGKKKADSDNLILSKIWRRKGQRIYADPMHKSITEMQRDLEFVYVGQICLSWEILSWLYVKTRELLKYDCNNRSYNRAAEEFQQFQVLMQRFVEDEQFQGQRIENYVKSRCMIRSLLHVPIIKDDCLKDKKERKQETDAISLESLVEMIRESMVIFREFLFADKKGTKGIQGNKIDYHQDCENSKILVDIITNLQKKERRIREEMRSQNCIVKKLKKHQECGFRHELLTSQVELRLVSRVVSLSRLTTDQLVWCQMKLKNISFVRRKVHLEPSFLLFPC